MSEYRIKIRNISQLIEQSSIVNRIVVETRNFTQQHKISINREIQSIERQHENICGSIYELQDIYEGWKEQQNQMTIRQENHTETRDMFEKNKQELEQLEDKFKRTYESITKQHEQLNGMAAAERQQAQISKAEVYDTVQMQLNKFCSLLQKQSNERQDFGQKLLKKVKETKEKYMQNIKDERIKRERMNESVLKIIEQVCTKLERRVRR